MGFSTYKPEWQETTPMEFKSNNPLIPGKVLLDTYHITVKDFDENGQECGEHDELCVTHASLLRWWQDNLMPLGCSLEFEPYERKTSGSVVKCTLTMGNLHVEALGEASCDNCSTDISKKHLTNTAENRAFDRAFIRFLALNLDEFDGVRQVFSSSEEIGIPKRADSAPAARAAVMPTVTPAVAPAGKPADRSSMPSWLREETTGPAPVNDAPKAPAAEKVESASPAEFPASLAGKTAPASEEAKPAKRDALDEFREERIAASKTAYTDQEYAGMMASEFYGLSNCEFNGKTFGEMLELLRSKNVAACKALQMYVKFRPFQSERLPMWKCLISYLSKEGLIRFYPTGNFFVGIK